MLFRSKSERGCPLRAGDAGLFAAFCGLLRKSGYTGEGVFARLGIAALTEFTPLSGGRQAGPVEDPLDLLIRLFMDEECAGDDEIRGLLPGALEAMEALGVAGRMPGSNPPRWFATVNLTPVGGLLIAADRRGHPGGEPFTPEPDVVYPVSEQTLRFLESLPPLPCARLLDLGTGTGIAALHAAAEYAGHAWATDITGRSAEIGRAHV